MMLMLNLRMLSTLSKITNSVCTYNQINEKKLQAGTGLRFFYMLYCHHEKDNNKRSWNGRKTTEY